MTERLWRFKSASQEGGTQDRFTRDVAPAFEGAHKRRVA